MKSSRIIFLVFLLFAVSDCYSQQKNISNEIDSRGFDPASLIWFKSPAKNWNEAIPVGNGRLGGMIYGGVDEEQIQLNESTYWTGGPYSSVVKGGYKYLPQIRKLVFDGKMKEAQEIFGRHLMGYPVEQQKYQSLGNLHLFFKPFLQVAGYKRWLDLKTGISGIQFKSGDITFNREVFSSAPDQVIVIRLTASKPGSISFTANLRGVRNQQHSDYATDYFKMDGAGNDGLILTGKSADYLGIAGKLRYKARLKATTEGGTMNVSGTDLIIKDADAVTLYFAAATNFINYKDVSANEHKRVDSCLNKIEKKSLGQIIDAHLADYQSLFDRVSLRLPETENSWLPTNERLIASTTSPDPQLAALAYQFGRYILIASSRPGGQAANLQGIWNNDMNPPWDSKYTTNINTQMNYWAVESASLPECAEPLIQMMKNITDQGAQVAKENYNCRGWVLHQNTDQWMVAAPMDGPTWGTFTTGGAWLCEELWDHYQYTGDKKYLRDIYPVIKGAVDFFMDYLVPDSAGKWLVTNPSCSPENFTGNPGNGPYFDETTGSILPGTTICAGSTIDMQIITDLFNNYIKATAVLGKDREYAAEVELKKGKLRPQLIGKSGALQEWAQDWPQLEQQHRHSSPLYGLYPGNVISVEGNPELIMPAKKLLNERGDGTSGWSRAWKTALWARLKDGDRANSILKSYFKEQAFPQLFAKGGTVMQVDATLGMTAAISEMLLQSNYGIIKILPALPAEWPNGAFKGVRTTGAFVVDISWKNGKIDKLSLCSLQGEPCRIAIGGKTNVTLNGRKIKFSLLKNEAIKFNTIKGGVYKIDTI